MKRIEKYDETLTSEVILLGAGLPVMLGTFFVLIGTLGVNATTKENKNALIAVGLIKKKKNTIQIFFSISTKINL